MKIRGKSASVLYKTLNWVGGMVSSKTSPKKNRIHKVYFYHIKIIKVRIKTLRKVANDLFIIFLKLK